jgi:hypothetical protein
VNINLKLFDKRVPFRVVLTKTLTPEPRPTFYLNPMAGYNPKTKSAYNGYVISDKETARNFVGYLLATVVATWPEMAEQFREQLK